MNLKFGKIKEGLPGFFKKLPLMLIRNFSYIILGGAIVALLFGAWIFYKDAYQVTNDNYEVFVKVRKINTRLFNEAKDYLGANDSNIKPLPSRNPFQP